MSPVRITETAVEYEEHVSKTTAIVRLKGSVDIMVSPLMLEALQRFVSLSFFHVLFLIFLSYLWLIDVFLLCSWSLLRICLYIFHVVNAGMWKR
jgi:hypothetical protein